MRNGTIAAHCRACNADGGNERILFRLRQGWALGADREQWILYRRRARNRWTERSWRPVAFIGSTRTVLQRVLREKGAVVDPEGQAALAALPATFREWRDERGVARRIAGDGRDA